jgi:hypothetical protein
MGSQDIIRLEWHRKIRRKLHLSRLGKPFAYKVIPFGLRNVSATYQRAMVTLFHDMMHQEVEVYVDDILVKSKKKKDNEQVLRKLFERLQKF